MTHPGLAYAFTIEENLLLGKLSGHRPFNGYPNGTDRRILPEMSDKKCMLDGTLLLHFVQHRRSTADVRCTKEQGHISNTCGSLSMQPYFCGVKVGYFLLDN